MYCAVSELSNTVTASPMAVAESLVQVTVVAGPPMEIQVRMNRGLTPLMSDITVNITPPGMVTSPIREK